MNHLFTSPHTSHSVTDIYVILLKTLKLKTGNIFFCCHSWRSVKKKIFLSCCWISCFLPYLPVSVQFFFLLYLLHSIVEILKTPQHLCYSPPHPAFALKPVCICWWQTLFIHLLYFFFPPYQIYKKSIGKMNANSPSTYSPPSHFLPILPLCHPAPLPLYASAANLLSSLSPCRSTLGIMPVFFLFSPSPRFSYW